MGRVPAVTSCWTSNTTSLPSNATWRTLLTHFLLKKQLHSRCHVALEPHRDMALTQCDVAPTFDPLSAQKPSSWRQPRRVGAPSRHRSPPMRRGAHFWPLFCTKSRLPAVAYKKPPAGLHSASKSTGRSLDLQGFFACL